MSNWHYINLRKTLPDSGILFHLTIFPSVVPISRESELMNGDSFWLTYKLAKYASSQWINHLTTPDTNATIFYQALQHFLAISVAKQVRNVLQVVNMGKQVGDMMCKLVGDMRKQVDNVHNQVGKMHK